jgi:hypothetical protein
MKHAIIIIVAALSLSLSCCETGNNGAGALALLPARGFHMGFSPFPYEGGSYEALEFIYGRIAADADLIAFHFDNGIPWTESLSGADYPAGIMDDWAYRKDHTPARHRVYIAITPLDSGRSAMAPAWTAAGDNQPLAPPWNGYALNHAHVKTAYLNYCRRMIAYFNPDYINIGIEVNLLKHNTPAAWTAYLELHRYVYAALKTEFPRLPIMVSLTAIDLLDGYTGANHADQMTALADIIDYTDYFGISLHPHLSAIIPDLVIPDDMFQNIFSMSDKPACITETSFLAEELTMADVPGYLARGTPEKQEGYVKLLLNAARQYRLKFVVYYLVRDYDTLWVQMGSPEGILKAWRDTGFYDGAGNPRPALYAWKAWLRKPVW